MYTHAIPLTVVGSIRRLRAAYDLGLISDRQVRRWCTHLASRANRGIPSGGINPASLESLIIKNQSPTIVRWKETWSEPKGVK